MRADRLRAGAWRVQAAAGRPRVFHGHIAPALASWQRAVRIGSTSAIAGDREAQPHFAESSTRMFPKSPTAIPSSRAAPLDEGDSIFLLYSYPSGHHRRSPKGVRLHIHRGAYLRRTRQRADLQARPREPLPCGPCPMFTPLLRADLSTWAGDRLRAAPHTCACAVEPKRIFDAISQHPPL